VEAWLEFARGPLFAVTFLIMALGLARHLVIQIVLIVRARHLLRGVPWRRILADAVTWTLPVRHLVRGTVAFTVVSFLFHLCAVLVPVFLADHIALWERFFGVGLPALSAPVADRLTLLAIGCGLVLLAYRVVVPRSRALSRAGDYLVMVLVMLPVASGYLAAHPAFNPLPWQAMMLIHLLSAEALFVVVPFSKLAHMVLFPFERLSQVYWRLQPGAGDEVARALWGEEVRV
jgi:nitrate reductase gamma subunit